MVTFTDVTHKLERLEALEEKAGVRLSALFACLVTHRENDLYVNGEVVGESSVPVERGVILNVSVHDSGGCVVGVGKIGEGPQLFRGFTTFSVRIFALPSPDFVRVRVYPTNLIY